MKKILLLSLLTLFLFVNMASAASDYPSSAWRWNGAGDAETAMPFHVHNDTWGILFKGVDDDGFIKTFKVGRMNNTIYHENFSTAEYFITDANTPDITEVYKDTSHSIFAISTGWQGGSLHLQTVNISHDGTINSANVSHIVADSVCGYYTRIETISDNIVSVIYSGSAAAPYNTSIRNFWIDNDGTINSTRLAVGGGGAGHKHHTGRISNDMWAVTMIGDGQTNEGNLTLEIYNITKGTITCIDSYEVDSVSSNVEYSSPYYLGNDTLAVAFSNEGWDVIITTIKVGETNGTIYNGNLSWTVITSDAGPFFGSLRPVFGDYFEVSYEDDFGVAGLCNATLVSINPSDYTVTNIEFAQLFDNTIGLLEAEMHSDVNNIHVINAYSYLIPIHYYDLGNNVTQSGIAPVNDSSLSNINPFLNVTINSTEAQFLNITIRSNVSGAWATLFWSNYSLNTSISFNSTGFGFNTSGTFWWSVNVTDGFSYFDNQTYQFDIRLVDYIVVNYITNAPNLSDNANTVFTILGILLVIGSITLILGLVYTKFR